MSASRPTIRERTREAAAILRAQGTPFVIHQPSYSMLNRWVEEDGLLDTLEGLGIGSIAFSPLAQGMLTDKYLAGIPETSRAAKRQVAAANRSSTRRRSTTSGR